jgi:hypothetical protein
MVLVLIIIDFPLEANIVNNYDYRHYLQKNADKLIMKNQIAACNNCGLCWNDYDGSDIEHGKYIFKSCNDKTQPNGYQNSDLKNIYLSREELAARAQPKFLTQDQMLKHFNYN